MLRCTARSVFLVGVVVVCWPSPSVVSADPVKPAKDDRVVSVKLIDDSVVKLTLLEDSIEFTTEYGKLSIPASDIQKIDLGQRISDTDIVRIQTAIAELGNASVTKHEAAAKLLLSLREKAYPALKRAMKSSDLDVSRRSEELVERLKLTHPLNRLEIPEYDLIHTSNSKIAGKITLQTLRAKSFTFGEVPLKLADVMTITTASTGPIEVVNAIPDPGQMGMYAQHVGKTFYFKVTGNVNAGAWGTGVYTLDSTLATAAVHMGVLKPGESGIVKVTILGPTVNFVGATQYGVTSSPYPNYQGAFRVHPNAD